MSDIVERLRDWGHPDWFYVDTELLEKNQHVRFEAADEIERLRAVIDLAARSLTAACLWRKQLAMRTDRP